MAPHLIDIDGDSCHHIHNFMKRITSHFGYCLERLFRDIYDNFQYSVSSLEILEGMVLYFGLSFRRPSNYLVTRWLSVLDAMLSFSYMLNVYMAYYNSVCIHHAKKALSEC